MRQYRRDFYRAPGILYWLVPLICAVLFFGCMPKAGLVRQGENPFADGAVFFEGNFRILMMRPKTYREEAQFGRARHNYDESISARLLSDFTLRFISSDNNIIVCSVTEHYACVLPLGRHEEIKMKTNSIVRRIALLILVQTAIVAIYFAGPEIGDSEGRIKKSKILQSG